MFGCGVCVLGTLVLACFFFGSQFVLRNWPSLILFLCSFTDLLQFMSFVWNERLSGGEDKCKMRHTNADPTSHRVRLWRGGSASKVLHKFMDAP